MESMVRTRQHREREIFVYDIFIALRCDFGMEDDCKEDNTQFIFSRLVRFLGVKTIIKNDRFFFFVCKNDM